jgi:hypothetical protein
MVCLPFADHPLTGLFFHVIVLICCAEIDNLNLAKWIYIFSYFLLTNQ